MVEPALVEVNGREGENEVAEPVGQAEEVRLSRGGRGRNHQVISGGISAGCLILLNAKSQGRRVGLRCSRNRIPLRQLGDLLHNRRC